MAKNHTFLCIPHVLWSLLIFESPFHLTQELHVVCQQRLSHKLGLTTVYKPQAHPLLIKIEGHKEGYRILDNIKVIIYFVSHDVSWRGVICRNCRISVLCNNNKTNTSKNTTCSTEQNLLGPLRHNLGTPSSETLR